MKKRDKYIELPSISIIIPIYNSEKSINRCVDSILAQTFTDFELILVDDGSKDKSYKICNEYAMTDARIVVIQQSNSGVSAARNTGLEYASGEYVCFVDSDDSIDNEMLEKMMLVQNESNADIVICGYKHIRNKNTAEIHPDSRIISGTDNIAEFIQDKFLTWMVGSPWGKVYRRSEQLIGSFDNKISLGEDLKFNVCTYCRANKIVVISDDFYNYYDSNNSLTKVYKKGNYEAICDIYQTTKNELVYINGVSSEFFKNVNYKLFSFCISFMSQNFKNASLKNEIEFVNDICNNSLLQEAVLDLPKMGIIRRLYKNAVMNKRVKRLIVYSYIKSKLID